MSGIRSHYAKQGILNGSHANWTSDGVVGFVHDIGKAGEASVTFAVGQAREKAVNYMGGPQRVITEQLTLIPTLQFPISSTTTTKLPANHQDWTVLLLLKPVFGFMTSDDYSETYAVHDIGTHYPNATGHDPEGEVMPVEESGNVLLLAYAYQHASGETDLTSNHADLLQQYAHYLEKNGKYPPAQLSLNDALVPLPNQTNLGVKAAVSLAASFADAIWNDRLGTNPDGTHFTIQYGNSTWFLVYNNYPDILFNFDPFPEESYNATSHFYPTVCEEVGVPLDGNIVWGQTNWQGFTAATVHGHAREMLIADMHAYISNGMNPVPFSDHYWVGDHDDSQAGEYYSFRARPTLGSHFALWALKGGNLWPG